MRVILYEESECNANACIQILRGIVKLELKHNGDLLEITDNTGNVHSAEIDYMAKIELLP